MNCRTADRGFAHHALCGVVGRGPNRRGLLDKNPMPTASSPKSQSLSPGSEVFANETVRTGNLGQADLVFLDQTNLTVGPTSEVLLDKFVYDPTGPKVVLQLTRGAFPLCHRHTGPPRLRGQYALWIAGRARHGG